MAAGLNWIIKDGLGQLGGVMAAAYLGDQLDKEPKRLRYQSSVLLQLCNGLELLTPWVDAFITIGALSNIGNSSRFAWLELAPN